MTGDDSLEERKPPDSGTADQSPQIDLLDRYEQMVQTQVETVNEIDDKAATTMRVVAVLLGILLSLLTFVTGDYSIEMSMTTVLPVIWVASGVATLLLSLALCLYTYLSSRMLFGPKAVFGDVLAENRVSWADYESKLLKGYATAITTNREVIRTNSRRFRNTLLTLVYGLVGVSVGLGLFIIDLPIYVDALVSVGVVLATGVFTVYILEERYMVIPHED